MTRNRHTYPSNYRPGSHWATDEAWAILDRLPVGLPDDHRFLLAGQIAGSLMRVAADRAQMLKALTAAAHALKSYQYGNASPDLAQSVAAACAAAIAAAGGEVRS